MKLAIGTAQFGYKYGFNSQRVVPKKTQVKQILNSAIKKNFNFLDTAFHYGNAEKIIGELCPNKHNFKVVTKSIKFDSKCLNLNDVSNMEKEFYNSLKKLRMEKIYAFLIHRGSDLLIKNGELLFKKMKALQDLGIIEKIGVSSYEKDEVRQIIERYDIDLIQIPINIMNQDMIESDFLKNIKSKNIEIHARSIFLQGFLAQDETVERYPNKTIEQNIKKINYELSKHNILLKEAAIHFVNQIPEIDVGVFGVENIKHLNEISEIHSKKTFKLDLQKFNIKDKKIVNPVFW